MMCDRIYRRFDGYKFHNIKGCQGLKKYLKENFREPLVKEINTTLNNCPYCQPDRLNPKTEKSDVIVRTHR